MSSPVRFSSCRGVAFEIKPNEHPFAIAEPTVRAARENRKFPSGSSKVFPASIARSISKTSSHFCDLDPEENEEDEEYLWDLPEEVSNDVETQKPVMNAVPIHSQSKREQPKNAKKRPSRLSIILLDQGLFTVYKRLFVVCLTLNITGLVLAATGHFPYARNRAAVFAIGNILALTLCRSELFLRLLFWLAVKLLGRSWVPIFLKNKVTALLQSVGGIHSGCGMSSFAWLIYALVLTLKNRENTSPEIIGVASSILGLLGLSIMTTFPIIRHLYHNLFERTHRFAGWTALALLWVFILLTISYDPETKSYSNDLGSKLVKSQEFWLTIPTTILIILPWLTIRRVPVKVYAPSNHASIIKFEGGVKAGILGRISPSPLSEWHAFGVISDGKKEHMILAGAVGDFTKSLVANPPTHLWVRYVYFAGLPYLVNMYERIIVVATGSGICVFLSHLLQPCRAKVCFLWVAKGIEQNFGKEITEWMSNHPEDRVIVHDTAVLGRPDVGQMSVTAARKWGAQVVFVTSNPEGSRDVLKACKAESIPAFAPIWDS